MFCFATIISNAQSLWYVNMDFGFLWGGRRVDKTHLHFQCMDSENSKIQDGKLYSTKSQKTLCSISSSAVANARQKNGSKFYLVSDLIFSLRVSMVWQLFKWHFSQYLIEWIHIFCGCMVCLFGKVSIFHVWFFFLIFFIIFFKYSRTVSVSVYMC